MRNPHFALILVFLGAGCHSSGGVPSKLLFDGLEGPHRAVLTHSPQAQRLYDQGWTLYCGFNHEEAIRSFQSALGYDPTCAMAWFGIGLSFGPNINNPTMDEHGSQLAFDATRNALLYSEGRADVERELIEALAQRYAWPPPPDRSALDRAWADALRLVWQRHPHDADVGALFAEALLDLSPWDQWTKDGREQPRTREIVETLEAVLAESPRHVLANHAYIHALEASRHPERALASADLLRKLVPGAGHLVHMPAHIDIRLGHYEAAARANERAIEADLAYVERAGPGGFYAIYRAHNYQFLAWAEMFEGRGAAALAAAREMVRQIPTELVQGVPQFAESYLGTPYHVLVRFGRWKQILAEPEPPAWQLATRADWHYARGIALAALGRVEEATFEQVAFEGAAAKVPADYLHGNNSVAAVLAVAREMLAGELDYRRGMSESAFEHLRRAVELDDGLKYDEPWGWLMPARHPLGALLAEQGRWSEAESVYLADLEKHPENGWALFGLEECLRKQGREKEASGVRKRFERAWARADVELSGSCFCRTGR
jgi:tetratricopeptide (TPR) repeat protein